MSTIKIIGANNISSEIIFRHIKNKLILSDSLGAFSKKITEYYLDNGFLQFKIDSIKINYKMSGQTVFWIQEGKRVKFGNTVFYLPEDPIFKQFAGYFKDMSGSPYSAQVLSHRIDSMLRYLEDMGYPLSRLEVSKVSFNEGVSNINFVLNLFPGPEVKFRSQKTAGNSMTKSSVILRETRIKNGDLFKISKIEKARENLNRTGFFRSVSEPVVSIVRDSANVIWNVKEAKTSTIDGVIGFHPPENDRSTGYVTGRLQFTFKNFLGTGRFIDVLWEKKDELSQKMNLGFEEPWIMGIPLNCGFEFKQEIRDSTYIERKLQVNIKYFPSSSFSLSVKGGTRDVFPDSAGVVYQNIPQTHAFFTSAGLEYNTLDNPYNPKQGVRYTTFFTAGRRKINGPGFLADTSGIGEISSYRKFSADVEIVINIFKNNVVYLGLHGRENNFGNKYVPLSDQIRFGGAATLRGYDEDSFNGTRAAWMNTEYRLITGFQSRVFLFVDSGMYQRVEKSGDTVRKFKIGYGAGLRIETRLGVVGIDYGLAYGNSFSEGKIHIRVINRF